MGRFFRVAQIVVLCLGTSSMMTSTLFAQDKAVDLGLTTQQFGMPVDWSTPHVIYTANGSVENMMAVRSNPHASSEFEGNTTRSPGICVKIDSPHWLWYTAPPFK